VLAEDAELLRLLRIEDLGRPDVDPELMAEGR
jgi:hypothetical protein